MEQSLPRVLTVTVMCACAGLLAVAACTHTTDRVLEPVGGGDASTTEPAVGDASLSPIGPVARPPTEKEDEPSNEFRLARSPEFGAGRAQAQLTNAISIQTSDALGGAAGTPGYGGGAGRGTPVAAGGARYF